MTLRTKESAAPPPGDNPLEYVMSDGSVDRMGDVLEPDGWQLDAFRKNPIALFGHDSRFPIGKWRDVGVRGGQLTGWLELLDPVTDRLREIHAAVKAGVLRAVSVGFHPKAAEPIKGSEFGMRFTEQELVECSLVSVPANPNALAIAKSLGISPQGQQLIFGAHAKEDHPVVHGGTHGVHAKEDSSRKFKSMSISERLTAAQEDLVGLRDQMTTLDPEADLARMTDLTAKIEEVQQRIATWQRAEKALGDTSEPITVPAGRTTVLSPGSALPTARPKSWAMPKKKDEEPGYLFIRHCAAIAKAHVMHSPLDQVLHEMYGAYGDFELVKGVHEWYVRAATAPATTTTTGWAAELAQTTYGEFFDALMPGGIYGPLAPHGFRATLGRYAQITMPTRQSTPTVAGSFVGEGSAIPVRQPALTAVTMGLKKMAVIVSYTREIAEHSAPQIEQIIRQLVQDDTQVAVDTVVIDSNAATAIRPAGLRNGVSVTAATAGGGFTALVTDIKNLVSVLAAANSLRSPVWIMNPVQQIAISLTQNAGGDFPFQTEINGNRLMGYPVIVSSTVPTGMVILVDAADFMSVTGDDPRFDVSDQATLHYEDTSPAQISSVGTPNVVAAPVRSLFQTDSLALRMILPMNWAMRRTGVIAWTQTVTW